MKQFFSLILLIVMMSSAAAPLIELSQADVLTQLLEDDGHDDGHDDGKDEFKVEKEKEVYTYSSLNFIQLDIGSNDSVSESLYYKFDEIISEYHTFLPEIPPEA